MEGRGGNVQGWNVSCLVIAHFNEEGSKAHVVVFKIITATTNIATTTATTSTTTTFVLLPL